MPAADRNKPKPGHKHLNTLNVPDADLAAISHAAIDAGQTRMEYIRALIRADAERVRAKQQPAAPGEHVLEMVLRFPDAATAANFQAEIERTLAGALYAYSKVRLDAAGIIPAEHYDAEPPDDDTLSDWGDNFDRGL